MLRNNKYLSGAFMLAICAITVKVFGVLFKVPLSYVLTEEGMGYFNSAYTVYSFFYILSSAGIPKAVSLVVGEYDERDRKKVLALCIKVFGISGFIISLLFIISAPTLSTLIGNTKATQSMLLIAPSILLVSLVGVYRGLLNSLGRHIPIALSQLCEAVFKLVIGISLAYWGKSAGLGFEILSALSILGITIGSLFSLLLLSISAKTSFSKDNIGQSTFLSNNEFNKKGCLRRALSVAIPISLTASISNITGLFDLGIIMRRLQSIGYTEAMASALYGNYTTLSLSMFNLIISIITPLSITVLPVLISERNSGNNHGFQEKLSFAILLTNLIASPCAIMLHLYSFELLDVLFMSSASATGAELLSAVAPGLIFLSSLTMFNTAHEVTGNIKYSVISLTVCSFTKIVLSYILIGNEAYGIKGASISTVISYCLGFLMSLYFLNKQKIKISIFTDILFPVVLSILSYYPPYMLFYNSGILGYDITTLITLLGLSTILFVAISIMFYKKRFKQSGLLTKLTKNKIENN